VTIAESDVEEVEETLYLEHWALQCMGTGRENIFSMLSDAEQLLSGEFGNGI